MPRHAAITSVAGSNPSWIAIPIGHEPKSDPERLVYRRCILHMTSIDYDVEYADTRSTTNGVASEKSVVRPTIVPELEGARLTVADFSESPRFVGFITLLILINAVSLGLETVPSFTASYGDMLYLVDRSILIIFTIEVGLKLYAYRLRFFASGWNVFDFLIVTIAWFPASGPLAILRALRVLRVLRLLSVVPQLRRVISAIGHSIPGMISVIGVLCLVFYVSAVLTTKLFGQHPDPRMQEWFGSIAASAYSLFQIMTLESWSMGIVRPTMELFPYAWVFFVPFIIVTSFAVLNLFIGIIVDAMQSSQEQPRALDRADVKQFTHAEIQSLHERFDELNREVARLATSLREVGRG